jgi:hypothetical protein
LENNIPVIEVDHKKADAAVIFGPDLNDYSE